MKCPKCHYLSFEPEPRCRNCGYDLELSADDLGLAMKQDEQASPLADLELRAPGRRAPATGPSDLLHPFGDLADEPDPEPAPADEPPVWAPMGRSTETVAATRATRAAITEPDVDETGLPAVRRPAPPVVARSPGLPKQPAEPRRPQARPAPTTELPLFVKGMAADAEPDEPLVRVPAQPRPPVAVQRRTPPVAPPAPPPARKASVVSPPVEPPRRLDTFGRDLLQDLERLDRRAPEKSRAIHRATTKEADGVAAGTRLSAAVIDLGFLGTIAIAMFWLTLRWCGLTFAQAATVPMVPLAAFVLMVVVGYLLLFTAAGGQTLGKMACGLRVADAQEDGRAADPVTPRQAFLRAVITVPSVLALGAGFVPALVGDGRALHDRLSQTRVVRA